MNYVVFVVRIMTICSFMVYSSYVVISRLPTFPSSPSTSDFIEIMHAAISVSQHCVALYYFWKNEDFLRSLLGSRNHAQYFNEKTLVAWSACLLYWVGWGMYKHSKRPFPKTPKYLALIEVTGIWLSHHLFQTQYLFFILYLQGEEILLGHLKSLHTMVDVCSEQHIISEKVHIRRLVRQFNLTFSNFLAVMYLKIFGIMYHRVVGISHKGHLKPSDVVWISLPSLYVVFLYLQACKASNIINICRQTEFKVKTQITHKSVGTRNAFFEETMKYTHLHDALKIHDCFDHSKDTFFTYMNPVITCIGMLIQFDYRLMATMDWNTAHAKMGVDPRCVN